MDLPNTTTTPSPSSDSQIGSLDDTGEDEFKTRNGMNDGFLWERLVPVDNVENGYDFAYDYTGQTIFWLEHNHTVVNHAMNIKRVGFDGEDRRILTTSLSKSQLEKSLSEPYCLAFDASSRNLILGSTSQSDLSALNVDNLQRTVIFSGSNADTGVGWPTLLTINSHENEIYWIDEGFDAVPKKIAAVKSDGSSPRIIVKNDLLSPQTILYHAKSKKIYWTDSGRKKIESISIEDDGSGSTRSQVISDVEMP
jgi:hypothetical protein